MGNGERFFQYQLVTDVKCHVNIWVYGHTAHAYSNVLNQNDKETDFLVIRVVVEAAKQRANESGG